MYLFSWDRFWTALLNTLYFVVVFNLLMLFLALTIAVTLSSEGVRLKKLFRTIYFIPITVSLAIVAIVFDRVFAKDIGFLNLLLKAVLGHKGDVGWLTAKGLVMPSFIMMRIWRATGYYAAFLYAGLLSVPKEIYESTKIDGAGPIRTFFSITIPLIVPVIVFCLIMSTVYSFQLFDEPWILNMGGPADASLTLQILLYQVTFTTNKFGLGCAISWVMTLIMIVFSMFYSYVLEGRYSVSPEASLV
jgi:ABC-type sugar transport system permease subunit